MKTFLKTVAAFFVALVLLIGTFIGITAYQGRNLDASSKAYVETNVPPIISAWSKDELVKRSSPEMLKSMNSDPLEIEQVFDKLSGLGELKSFADVKGEAGIRFNPVGGKTITAGYKGTATFAAGTAEIAIALIQNSGQWQILGFHVDSPVLHARK